MFNSDVTDETDETPPPSSLAAVAECARQLADTAARLAELDPAELVPADGRNPLVELDEAANELRGAVAGVRREVWWRLGNEGWTYAQIGEAWGVTRQAISNALRRG